MKKVKFKSAIEQAAETVDVKEIQASLVHVEPSAEALILRAQVAYLTDPNLRDVEVFWTITEGACPLEDFVARANREHWKEQRSKIVHQIRGEIVRRMGKQIIADQIREAREVQNVRQWMYDYITPEFDAKGVPIWRAEVKSMEGMIKAFRDITLLLQLYRSTIGGDLAPDTIIDVQAEPQNVPFTSAELVQVAHEVLKKRIEKKK